MANSCKIDNVWRGINKFFKKENGSWTEISSSPIKSYIMGKSLEYGGDFGPEVVDEAFSPSGSHAANINVIYSQTTGKPNVKTDENGAVTYYEYTESGVTVSDVDTGIIAFDSNKPGWTLHLVADMTPNDNNNKNIIQAYNSTNRRGLYVYGVNSYCYKKVQTADYNTNSTFVVWSKFSPTGKDSNYYKTLSTITFDVVYTTDKKLSLYINGVEHFSNFAVDDGTFQNLTIKVGVGMTNFTIREFKVERTYGTD